MIELLDHHYVVAQIIGREAEVLNSVTVAFFDQRVTRPEDALHAKLSDSTLFSTAFSTRDLLDMGVWQVEGSQPIAVSRKFFPYEHLRGDAEWVGARVYGSGILNDFLNAFYALRPWDDGVDPAYFDKILISSDKKPKNLIYKSLSKT